LTERSKRTVEMGGTKVMNTLTKMLAAATIALGGIGAAAEKAEAQQLLRIADVASVGGFVIHSDAATIWAEMSGSRVVRGRIRVERTFRGGAQPSLVMTGQLDATETLLLWNSLYRAAPWRHKQVVARSTNTDFPDTHVTYLGRYKQEILAGLMSPPPRMPRVSNAMIAFLDLAWDAARRTAEAPLFVYDASGGRLGYRRLITIARDGKIVDEVSYANPSAPGTPYRKEGQLTSTEIDTLKNAARHWPAWPRSFPGDPRAYDGIGIDATLYTWGVKKTVGAGEPSSRPRDFQGLLNLVESLADRIP
jgi:hypothetical protein